MTQTSKSRTARVRRITLKDIAGMAGVSVSTASLVLAGKSADRRISREVEERVRDIAVRHDYNPNLLVKSMQRGRTHVLAFYSAFRRRERNDLYMDRLSTAILRGAGERGYDVLTYCDFSRPTGDIYRHINGGLADGLVFFGPYESDPLLPLLRESRLPVVLLLHEDAEDKLCSVVEDVREGIRRIAVALVDQGHRRIAAAISPPGDLTDSHRRLALLRASLASLGVSLPDEMVAPISDDDRYPAEDALRRWMALPEPPTALFCWHDRLGYRILEACDRLNLRIPQTLSLIGYDGLHWPSLSSHVLTSVAVDIDAAASAALGMLDGLINGESPLERTILLPVRWEEGTTFGPAPHP
ncbi:MAG: LacI family DNA-binding transcriptional regulator [Capsulimonadales bacterium]|nr:LacI family DNA-binding transcriptional regulator [Capsulimonadales bacterium]